MTFLLPLFFRYTLTKFKRWQLLSIPPSQISFSHSFWHYYSTGKSEKTCQPSRCDKTGPEIRFPFRIKGLDSPRCGFPGFELSCHGKETIIELPILQKLRVKSIDYKSKTIELHNNTCLFGHYLKNMEGNSVSPFKFPKRLLGNYTMFNCSEANRGDWAGVSCVGEDGFQLLVAEQSSSILQVPLAYCSKIRDLFSFPYQILNGDSFQLDWTQLDCSPCEAKGIGCQLKNSTVRGETECFEYSKSKIGTIRKIVAIVVTLGVAVMIALLVLAYHTYSYNKQGKEDERRIEKFLEDYKAAKPSRYSYRDIKHITEQFKHKLGDGAFGSVYRGKLSNDYFVVVKILNITNGNGEEFINEVKTIGRIHHVNVVRLVGYCAEGFRRAIVYEYLSKGSLQSHISSPDEGRFLGWNKLQDIALGLAKGIEYLHQGCDHRILYFDIKPHNILLDQNFIPKVSDFGLLKLCTKYMSPVSMSMDRGTFGYVAPEVLSRNFRNVWSIPDFESDSYSDSISDVVYSFGMVLLEIVGGRRIADNDTSKIYYPEWIYNLLEGDDILIRVKEEEEDGAAIAKRLAIVGLWCIQWLPADRPSIKTAVHMLQGKDALTLPPNPFASAANRTNPELYSIAEQD